MKESVIPKKLSDELEDVAKVYNSKSGMVVYPDSFSKLRTEIMKVCNEKQIAEKHILELIADKGKLIDEVNELKQKNDELEKDLIENQSDCEMCDIKAKQIIRLLLSKEMHNPFEVLKIREQAEEFIKE